MPKSYYPPKPLREAEAIARTIIESGGGRPMVRLTIAKELDLAPEGRAFRELITASGGYGLTTGSYAADEIELQDWGKLLVGGDLGAAYEALFSVELFTKFHQEYKNAKVPSDQAAYDFLKRDCAVPDRQAKGVYSRMLQDARDWHIVQELKGAETVVPLKMARNKAAAELTMVDEGVSAPREGPEPGIVEGEAYDRRRVEIEPSLQLSIAIHIAADTPEDKIETIFRNMAKYLLPNE